MLYKIVLLSKILTISATVCMVPWKYVHKRILFKRQSTDMIKAQSQIKAEHILHKGYSYIKTIYSLIFGSFLSQL